MLPDAEFIDQLRRLNGTPAVVLEHSELLQLLVPTLRADFATCETYEFSPAPPLNCAITAIGGLGDEHVTRDDLIGWGQHTSSSFQLRMLPGDHFLLRSQQPLLLQLLKDAFAPSSKPAVREFSETHVDRPWPPAPKTLRLNTGDVHLWRARLDLGPSCIRRLRSLLSPDEMSRADRFRSAVDSNRFIAGRAQLREILAQCIQCEPTSLRFEYGPQGKPSLVGMTREPLQFNLAHSRGLALIAVCQGSEVGVDVEYTARDLDCDELARQVFSPGELTQFERVSVISDRKSMFFKCWTRKEAFLKAIGVGLSRAPCHIDAMLDADNWYQMECDPAGTAEPQIWTIRDLQPEADYAGAVAIRRPPANLQQWTWIQSLVAASPAVS
jgi:4'-phosphopantetheinyl transferase